MDNKSKQTIDTIWKKYKRTLTLLAQALDELEKKPREVVVNKPTQNTLEEIAATNDHLQKQINESKTRHISQSPHRKTYLRGGVLGNSKGVRLP